MPDLRNLFFFPFSRLYLSDTVSNFIGHAGIGVALIAIARRATLDWMAASSQFCAIRLRGWLVFVRPSV